MKRLIIAYGNRDREDDGAGWHILEKNTRCFVKLGANNQ